MPGDTARHMDPYLLLAAAEGGGQGMVPALLDPHAEPEEILAEPSPELPPAVRQRLISGKLHDQVESWLRAAERWGWTVLTPRMPAYPERLRMSPLRPLVLFAQGPVDLLAAERRAVAVVGSRTASAYGESAAWAFAGALARAGLPLWSGLALGIDSIAHRACLRHACPTIAVLAGGLDDIYPPQNRQLLERILDKGGLCLSELPPGRRPGRGHFPRRNRILAQSCEAILVVEAGLTSGSLHTANFGALAGVPVYAVPGPYSNNRSRGCHALIAEGAGIAACPETLLRVLGIDAAMQPSVDAAASLGFQRSADATALLSILETGPRPADLVRRESGLTEEQFLETVLDLVANKSLLQLPGDLLALGEELALREGPSKARIRTR